jgi:SagB-type dehydrogenase family enzyme
MTWREYHEATNHSPESLRRSDYVLDWANMPNPFRHYEGVPVLDLPADPPAPEIPMLELLQGGCGATPVRDGATFLSQLLFYSASISAWKRAPSGVRYALRVNPSSGNLHPTEFHFVTRGLKDWPDGLYHYRPSSHMAEQRAMGDFSSKLPGEPGPIVFILTSLVWREAWKYRERAYRYCLHDMGHASEALALSARAIGCTGVVTPEFADDEIARACRLSDDEWPFLMVTLNGASIPLGLPREGETVWFGGEANRLSSETIAYPLIEGVHAATKASGRCGECTGELAGAGKIPLAAPTESSLRFGEVARARRSALDFVGNAGMSLSQLSAILGVTDGRFVQLYLYVHQVQGLPAGVYRYWSQARKLERMKTGEQRVMAAGLSLAQELAGNACVAFSMVADLERAVSCYGERGYRYAHFEAGAIGQRLYWAAEAVGLRATGIGAFFDDQVAAYLGLTPREGQVIYHFAIGHPVVDTRLEA